MGGHRFFSNEGKVEDYGYKGTTLVVEDDRYLCTHIFDGGECASKDRCFHAKPHARISDENDDTCDSARFGWGCDPCGYKYDGHENSPCYPENNSDHAICCTPNDGDKHIVCVCKYLSPHQYDVEKYK